MEEKRLKWMQKRNTGFGDGREMIDLMGRRRRVRSRGRLRGREKRRWRRRRKKGRRGMMELWWRLARRILAGLPDDYFLCHLQKGERELRLGKSLRSFLLERQ